ncbi:MAG: DUF302 domain-containing protein [Bacteroidota bacterium]
MNIIKTTRSWTLLPSTFLFFITFLLFTACEQDNLRFSPELSPELLANIDEVATTINDKYDPVPELRGENQNLSITEYLSFKPELSLLAAAIDRVPTLAETLSNPAVQITLFAPTNNAFTALLAATDFDSLDDIPTEMLGMILMNHVLTREGRVGVIELEESENTLAEDDLDIDITGQETATINDGINVVRGNQFVGRSILHWIDGVILLSDDDTAEEEDNSLIIKQETASVDVVFDAIVARIEAQEGLMIAAQVDHTAAAAGVGLDLRPTKTVIFGNPAAGTQFMQSDQRIGIDLPLKFVVWEDEDGATNVAYYDAKTLTQRYSITDKDEVVNMVNMALNNLSGGGDLRTPNDTDNITDQLTVKASPNDVETTYNQLITALNGVEPISIIAEINHDMAATNVGLELRPTRLVIFGNPMAGTRFMQSDQRIGIDLPLKMLVWEDADGDVFVGYYNASTLTERYDIDDQEEVKNMVNMALNNLSAAAVQ